MNTPSRPVRLPEHIYHKSGEAKTVCVTACLTALGVPVDAYHYTGKNTNCNRREAPVQTISAWKEKDGRQCP